MGHITQIDLVKPDNGHYTNAMEATHTQIRLLMICCAGGAFEGWREIPVQGRRPPIYFPVCAHEFSRPLPGFSGARRLPSSDK